MTILEDLLRQQRWQLDERRRYVSELEALSERLRADLGLLRAAIALETGIHDQPSQSADGGRLVTLRLVERQRKLEHSVAEIESQIVEARAVIATAEHEIGAYELASSHRKGFGGALLPRHR